MKTLVKNFLKSESGATAIEYGLIAGLLTVAIIGAMTLAGGSLQTIFSTTSTTLDAAAATTP